MLSDFTPSVTISVRNLKAVRPFYEGILGFKSIGSTLLESLPVRRRGCCAAIPQVDPAHPLFYKAGVSDPVYSKWEGAP
jgi:hypothetical protein